MELFFIELMLWAGLVGFFWVMKNQLNQIESEIDKMRILPQSSSTTLDDHSYDKADSLSQEIGSYLDCPIHQLASIGGQLYRFDYVFPEGRLTDLRSDQRCVKPGLVYTLSHDIPEIFTAIK